MNVPVYGESYRKINADLQMLKVSAQSAPNMTVNVNPGSYWINGNTFYEFAGGTTTAVVNPTIGAYWVAVVLVGSAIQLVYGQSSADTPVFPALPSKSVPLAALYVKTSDTVITSDMIFDIRPIFAAGGYPEKHNDLASRDVVDCHPIDAITGLKDMLAGKVSTDAMAQAISKCAAFDGTKSKTFTLNAAETGSPSSDVYINVDRGNQPNAAIRYNEADNRWEFTDDGQSFKPFDSTIDIDPFNQDNYYVRADIDSKFVNVEKEIATKAEASVVANLSTAVANAATVDYVNNQFQNLYGKQAMDDIVAEVRKDVATMSAKANLSDVYTKTQVDASIATKANITDVYTKADVDTAVSAKANVADVYTKTDVDTALKDKANVETTYDKDTMDKLLADKTSAPDVYKYVDAQLSANMAKKQDLLGFVPENVSNKNAANGYAGLDVNGKILIDQLPDSAKQGTYIVDDANARNALTGLVSGSRAYETNTGDSYIYDGKQWKLIADADWANVKLDFANIDNKPTTLAGYGIADAAVKTEVETELALKANGADVYAKADVDTAMKAKANVADVYAKTEVDTALATKAAVGSSYTKAEEDSALALKANVADVYTKTDADKLFAAKANSADVYTKTEVDSAVAVKANAADVYAQKDADAKFALAADVAKMYTNDAIDNNISVKANSTDVYTKKEMDASMALKANVADVYKKTDVDTALAAKANANAVFTQTETTNMLASKVNTDDFTTFQETVSTTYITSADASSKFALKTALAAKANTADVYAKADKLPGADIVLTSPNGTKYSITVSDGGALTATKIV